MKIIAIIPRSEKAKTVHRDVLYGCWCKGKRIGGGTLPPLTLLSVATVLKSDFNDVILIDMCEENLSFNNIIPKIESYEVIVLLTSSMSFLEDVSFLIKVKNANPDIKTIVMGSHVTFMPESSLKHQSIDFIIKKEPQFIIRDLIRLLKDKKDYTDLKGIGFRDGKGNIIINEDYPFVKEYDLIPISDRTLLPAKARYFNPIIRHYPYTTTTTSQGCPGRCTFCTAPQITGNKLRYWSADKVLEEIKYLVSLGYKEIYYRDETFTTFKKRNMALFKSIIEKKYNISWLCNVRADTVDKEDLKLMKDAGCRLIKVGVETGSQKILDITKKHITIEDVRNVFKWCREIGIDTHAHLMYGMPGETIETLRETISFIKEISPTTIDIGICTPYPGTPLFDELIEKYGDGIARDEYIDMERLHIKAKYNELFTEVDNETIEEYITRTYRDFYLNFGYIWRWYKRTKDWKDLINVAKSGFNVLQFAFNREGEISIKK